MSSGSNVKFYPALDVREINSFSLQEVIVCKKIPEELSYKVPFTKVLPDRNQIFFGGNASFIMDEPESAV